MGQFVVPRQSHCCQRLFQSGRSVPVFLEHVDVSNGHLRQRFAANGPKAAMDYFAAPGTPDLGHSTFFPEGASWGLALGFCVLCLVSCVLCLVSCVMCLCVSVYMCLCVSVSLCLPRKTQYVGHVGRVWACTVRARLMPLRLLIINY